jgi:hypothetical protein
LDFDFFAFLVTTRFSRSKKAASTSGAARAAVVEQFQFIVYITNIPDRPLGRIAAQHTPAFGERGVEAKGDLLAGTGLRSWKSRSSQSLACPSGRGSAMEKRRGGYNPPYASRRGRRAETRAERSA